MISEDYKEGYIQGVTAILSLIFSEMDDELKDIILKNLNLKKV